MRNIKWVICVIIALVLVMITFPILQSSAQDVNVFDKNNMMIGFYDALGNYSTDDYFRTSDFIAVSSGDIITFGAAETIQGWHIILYNASKSVIGTAATTSGISISASIDEKYSIMSYTVTSGTAYIRMVLNTSKAELYLVTKNRSFSLVEYYACFGMDDSIIKSPLYKKSALFCGDSISAGQWDDGTGVSNNRAWGGRIGDKYSMNWRNVSIGGYSLSTVRSGRIISQFSAVKNNSYDYVILEGGVNDAWGDGTTAAPIGTVASTYKLSDFDVTTYAGALEELFYYAVQYWGSARIGYIMTFRMPGAAGIGNLGNIESYFAVGMQICKKWGIEYYDMYHDDALNAALNSVSGLQDPVHPNGAGYEAITPFVDDWMQTLTPYDKGTPAKTSPVLNNGEMYLTDDLSLGGWSQAFSTEIYRSYDSEQTDFSLAVYGTNPTGHNVGGNYVGAMCHYTFLKSMDLSLFTTIKFDYYLSKSMGGKQGSLQLNFITTGEDGYNTQTSINGKAAGWHSAEISTKNTGYHAVAFDWKSINKLRFTWWNNNACVSSMVVKIKNIRLSGSNLQSKTAAFFGDSISAGSNDEVMGYHYAWAGRIGAAYGMTVDNRAESGWSVSNVRGARIIDQVRSVKSNKYDYIILHGGVNDAWESAPVGVMKSSYNPSDFDLDTYGGALEYLFYFAHNYFPDSKIGYIINFKCPNATFGTVNNMTAYFNLAKQICQKWNIPYLDMYNDSYVNDTLLSTSTAPNTYMADTVHPSSAGYDRIYSYVAQWINTLVENDISSFENLMAPITNYEAHLPYGDKFALCVNDGENKRGWSAQYDSTISVTNGRYSGSALKLVGKSPTKHNINGDSYVGAMMREDLYRSVDLSSYDTISFDYYISENMTSKQGLLQMNFCTKGEDGYNATVNLSGKKAGWHTAEISMNSKDFKATDFNWNEIRTIRVTWWNTKACVSSMNIVIDNIFVYNTNDVKVGDVGLDGKIDVIDALRSLRCAVGLDRTNPCTKKASDVNSDSTVTSVDSLLILQYAVEYINKF